MAMHGDRVRKVVLRRCRTRNNAENIDELEGWMVGTGPTEPKK